MEILFIGSEVNGNFAVDTCERRGDNLTFSGNYQHVREIINVILDKSDPEYQVLIVDVEMFLDDSDEIADTLQRIQKVNNAKVIIYASGYRTDSQMIIALLRHDFQNYILAVNPSAKIDQLEKGLNNYYEINGMDELQPIKSDVEAKDTYEANLVYKTIGIAGALSRIGATSQAIQIVKYLTLLGYKACYIQMNNHGFLDGIKDLYNGYREDPSLCKITYQSVDMFKKDKISEVLKMGYDYYIKDYGVYASNEFENLSFLEQDINIIVAGAKPEESDYILQVLTSAYYQDAFYIFSFVPKADYEDVLDLMDEKSKDTVFAIYTPDPFVYSTESDHIYKKILNVKPLMSNKKRWHIPLPSFLRKEQNHEVEKAE